MCQQCSLEIPKPLPMVQPCPLCGGSDYLPIKEFADGVCVGQCRGCGLMYTPLRHPSPASLFDECDPAELRVLLRPIAQGRKRHFRYGNYLEYLRLIERHVHGRRFLDVGCAHGCFPALARKQGYEVMGIEPNPAMAAFASDMLGIRVLRGRLDEVPLEGLAFDVITMTDCLEYIPQPVSDLRRLAGCLAPGGLLFLKVPNGDYFRSRHRLEKLVRHRLGSDEAFSPSLRVVHYTRRSISRLVDALGLSLVEVGTCRPVDSSPWSRIAGLHLEIEAPWFFGLRERVLRQLLHAVGRTEAALTGGANHLSPSIYALARRDG